MNDDELRKVCKLFLLDELMLGDCCREEPWDTDALLRLCRSREAVVWRGVAAKCPYCDGVGWTAQPHPNTGEACQVQCQYCYECEAKAKELEGG